MSAVEHSFWPQVDVSAKLSLESGREMNLVLELVPAKPEVGRGMDVWDTNNCD